MNLLKETIEDIKESGHKIDDIIFIGSKKSGHSCSWSEFEKLANREYSSGFGAAEVAQDLIIVFNDGSTMRRGEYDGSEWWEYSKPFKQPKKTHKIINLFCDDIGAVGWCDLSELNDSAPPKEQE